MFAGEAALQGLAQPRPLDRPVRVGLAPLPAGPRLLAGDDMVDSLRVQLAERHRQPLQNPLAPRVVRVPETAHLPATLLLGEPGQQRPVGRAQLDLHLPGEPAVEGLAVALLAGEEGVRPGAVFHLPAEVRQFRGLFREPMPMARHAAISGPERQQPVGAGVPALPGHRLHQLGERPGPDKTLRAALREQRLALIEQRHELLLL